MKIPRYGMMISTITQIALAQPEMSCRRNRSLNTVISSQNHSTKMNIEKTSARKLEKVKPPENNMSSSPSTGSRMPSVGWEFNLRLRPLPPARPAALPPWSRRTSCASPCRRRQQCGQHLVGRHPADKQEQGGVAGLQRPRRLPHE